MVYLSIICHRIIPLNSRLHNYVRLCCLPSTRHCFCCEYCLKNKLSCTFCVASRVVKLSLNPFSSPAFSVAPRDFSSCIWRAKWSWVEWWTELVLGGRTSDNAARMYNVGVIDVVQSMKRFSERITSVSLNKPLTCTCVCPIINIHLIYVILHTSYIHTPAVNPTASDVILPSIVSTDGKSRSIWGFLRLLPPPKKEVMFLVRSVCLSVCLSVRRITRKLVNGFWQNYL